MTSDVENIIDLLGPREVIGQAINLLMAHHDVNRDAAFEMWVHGSCGARQKVRDIAAEIVEKGQPELA